MKERLRKWLTMPRLICLMVLTSLFFYVLHYVIFRDLHHILIFGLHDIAFMPIEVLLTIFVFDHAIEEVRDREKRSKVALIENIFFSEAGNDMIRYLNFCDPNRAQLSQMLKISESWSEKNYHAARKAIRTYSFELPAQELDFFALNHHLNTRHSYFLKVLQNPSLTDQQAFTSLILTSYLLWDELKDRTDLLDLPADERVRLSKLVSQLYRQLTEAWLDNLSYLHESHPERMALVCRQNPFA